MFIKREKCIDIKWITCLCILEMSLFDLNICSFVLVKNYLKASLGFHNIVFLS